MYLCTCERTANVLPITQVKRGIRLRSVWHYVLFILLVSSWSMPLAYADDEMKTPGPAWESRHYLIEGIHYLINEGNQDMAEELFRKAIFSSSFSALSREGDIGKMHALSDRWTVAEAFYFLGKIHYERAMLDTGYSMPDTGREEQESSIQHPASSIENIAWAKKYLRKAEEYGIVYDRLHPALLDEINRKYPNVDAPISRPSHDKARVTIQIEHGSYQLNVVKVDKHTDIIQSEFLTNEEFGLECGGRYKVKPDIQGGHRAIYRALTILGVGLAVWFTRG